MNSINFKHNYRKLHSQNKCTLLSIKELTNTNEMLRVYDTMYTDNGKTGDHPLRGCPCLHLTFIGNLNIPFSAIRSIKKKDYYDCKIGEEFEIIIEAGEQFIYE